MSRSDDEEYKRMFGRPVHRTLNRPTFQRDTECDCNDFRSWYRGPCVYPELIGLRPWAPIVGTVPCCEEHPDARIEVAGVHFPGYGLLTVGISTHPDASPGDMIVTASLDWRLAARIKACSWGHPGLLGHLPGGACGALMDRYARVVLGGLAATIYAVHPGWCGGQSAAMDAFVSGFSYDDNGVAYYCSNTDMDMRAVVLDTDR